MSQLTEEHGWTAVPRDLGVVLASRESPHDSQPVKVSDMALPDSELIGRVRRYAEQHLSKPTFNHSMRVYYFGQAIMKQHFPEWVCSAETLLLTALLHDLGTTEVNQSSTRLSFEFFGAIRSLDLLKSLDAEIAQAEAVCETIIRHQDLGDSGYVTTLTSITHFATLLDNAGQNADLVHPSTIQDIVACFPRHGWTGCFSAVVRKECDMKPWANTSRIQEFAQIVEGNELMKPYD